MLQQYIDIVNENLALKKEYLKLKSLYPTIVTDDSEAEGRFNLNGNDSEDSPRMHRNYSLGRNEQDEQDDFQRMKNAYNYQSILRRASATDFETEMSEFLEQTANNSSDEGHSALEGGGAAEEKAAAEQYQMLLKRNAEAAAEQTLAEITDKVTRDKFIMVRILRKTAEVIADLNPVKKAALQTFLDLVKKNDEDFIDFSVLKK